MSRRMPCLFVWSGSYTTKTCIKSLYTINIKIIFYNFFLSLNNRKDPDPDVETGFRYGSEI
jgi:hypothetical protein